MTVSFTGAGEGAGSEELEEEELTELEWEEEGAKELWLGSLSEDGDPVSGSLSQAIKEKEIKTARITERNFFIKSLLKTIYK